MGKNFGIIFSLIGFSSFQPAEFQDHFFVIPPYGQGFGGEFRILRIELFQSRFHHGRICGCVNIGGVEANMTEEVFDV